MAKKKQQPIEHEEKPEVEEFMEIGGSPVPGMTLRQVLREHKGIINHIAWSPDGRYLISASDDNRIIIWNVLEKNIFATLENPSGGVIALACSPNGEQFVSGDRLGNLVFWDITAKKSLTEIQAHENLIRCLAWSNDGKLIASGSFDNTIKIWDSSKLSLVHSIQYSEKDAVLSLLWLEDKPILLSGLRDSGTWMWDGTSNTFSKIIQKTHEPVVSLKLSHDGTTLLTSSHSRIFIWDMRTWKEQKSIEGHTNEIKDFDISPDGLFIASKSNDNTLKLWDARTGAILASISELGEPHYWSRAPYFHPNLPLLASLGEGDTIVRIWEINFGEIVKNSNITNTIQYTTAKLVLVGDSGVGKTGLGWRLAHNEFKEHSSTHGQQFWVVPELKKTREDGTECEAVLWDLAGQHIYRSIHSIFLDDVDASLVLFDPTNRQEPLKGAQFWLEQLKGKKQLPPSVLVGARLDRGAPVLSQQELDQFCQKYGISGGYIGTSAKSGEGLDKLLESLKDQIPWDQMTTTVTTVTFKRIKEYVLSLKEKTDRKGVLVHPAELREQLQATDKDWDFTDAEMMTAAGHLANHGYVSILHSSSGEEHILLVPELLVDLASSIVLLADRHAKELGAVNETELLQGKYQFDELKGLAKEEQQILLDAAVLRFLEHSICFRETLGNDTLLIFPSLIKQKRPLQDEFDSVDSVSYILRGRVENIYASLVVLLGYTTMFTRINQWQNQAQYEMGVDEICGFRLIEEREGELELVLYYSTTMPTYGRTMFQGLFESFLYKRDIDITRFPPVSCINMHLLQRSAVIKRVLEGKNFMFCDECGEKTILPEIEKPTWFEREESQKIRRNEAIAQLRKVYETYMVRIKGFRRDRSAPRCYISFVEADIAWSEKFIDDLKIAGIQIVENRKGITDDDLLLIVDTPSYQANPIKADIVVAKSKFDQGKKSSVIRLQTQGAVDFEETRVLPVGDMRPDSRYAVSLFDLVLRLYAIPLEHPAFKPLRESLQNQWEQTLGQMVNGREIYISYAWGGESEKIVNDLDQAFQAQGVTIVRDKRDLGYKGRIKSFMETIGQGKAVVLVISEKYLKSENCMFELLQVAKNGEFTGRIFPIVLEDARIYKAIDRIRYVEHWEKQLKELDAAMKGVSAANMDGFREDIDLYDEIRDNLPRLSDILKDMNTLTPELHRQSGFKELIDAVMAKLEE